MRHRNLTRDNGKIRGREKVVRAGRLAPLAGQHTSPTAELRLLGLNRGEERNRQLTNVYPEKPQQYGKIA